MDVDETMDTPVRVGSGDHRQNSEQNHMGQTIQLAFSPSGVFDFDQQRQKRGELHGNLGSSDSGCLSKSQRFCVAGILNRLAQPHFTRGCGNLDSPFKYRALHSRDEANVINDLGQIQDDVCHAECPLKSLSRRSSFVVKRLEVHRIKKPTQSLKSHRMDYQVTRLWRGA